MGGTISTTGETATATITAVNGVVVPDWPRPGAAAILADLTLQVTRENGVSYQTATWISFPSAERCELIGQVGVRVPVWIDPDHPDQVMIPAASAEAAGCHAYR